MTLAYTSDTYAAVRMGPSYQWQGRVGAHTPAPHTHNHHTTCTQPQARPMAPPPPQQQRRHCSRALPAARAASSGWISLSRLGLKSWSATQVGAFGMWRVLRRGGGRLREPGWPTLPAVAPRSGCKSVPLTPLIYTYPPPLHTHILLPGLIHELRTWLTYWDAIHMHGQAPPPQKVCWEGAQC